MQIWHTTLWIQRLYFVMLKVKLWNISSSGGWRWYWSELCPLCTLRWERPSEERDNQILWWHNKSHQLFEILSQWTWNCEKLDFSVIVWKFVKLTLVSVTCSKIRINKRLKSEVLRIQNLTRFPALAHRAYHQYTREYKFPIGPFGWPQFSFIWPPSESGWDWEA